MRTPCEAAPEAWVGDDMRLRQEAARECAPCPMKQKCLEDAVDRGERWGVWGGFDFSNPLGRSTPVVPKPCKHCGALFGARTTESTSDFNARQFCSRRCANTASSHARRDAKRAAA